MAIALLASTLPPAGDGGGPFEPSLPSPPKPPPDPKAAPEHPAVLAAEEKRRKRAARRLKQGVKLQVYLDKLQPPHEDCDCVQCRPWTT